MVKKALHCLRHTEGITVSDNETDEVFDEEELAEGFDEEILGADDIDDVDIVGIDDVDDVDDVDDEATDDEILADVEDDAPDVLAEVATSDDEDLDDDADVELALDEVLAETIRRTTLPEDDEDEAIGEIDTSTDATEAILPKQDDEFRCSSCRLLKKMSQLADETHMLCRDCV